MLRINLGSGQRRFSGDFINCDINPRWEPDVVADGAHMPMFEDGSAELIVSHHSLEHARCGEGAPMLKECLRVLLPGGSMIVCVPNMRALAEGWLQGRITTQIYMTNVYGAFMDSPVDQHAWGYDYQSLKEFLLSCGFSRIKPFDFREIPGADIAQDWWILAIEATK